jgi:VIT1/CCC1 family predicted Fe2+/Mn2+ transporter
MRKKHILAELHRSSRIGWLRAGVLGANDGILSTASLIVGVAAANTSQHNIIISGIAGLVAGSMSMAAGEYVSVSSQADTEEAELARERDEQITDIKAEREELAQIYINRGLEPKLARQVSLQLMAHDPIGSHARDELGITESLRARPVQAALVSAGTFSVGAALPLFVVFIIPLKNLILAVSIASLFFLVLLGMLAAKVGGANFWKGAVRVGFWGALAMTLTAIIGAIFGTIV